MSLLNVRQQSVNLYPMLKTVTFDAYLQFVFDQYVTSCQEVFSVWKA